MKYNLINEVTGQPTEGIIIDATAKEDFMELMNWKEDDWKSNTQEVEEPRADKLNLSKKRIRGTEVTTKGWKVDMDFVDAVYSEKDVKEFIQKRIMESTKLIALFNQDKLTSMDLREHRQGIKDDAGDKLI